MYLAGMLKTAAGEMCVKKFRVEKKGRGKSGEIICKTVIAFLGD